MSEAVENPGFGREGPGALRRRWSDAEKRRIVAESYQPGVSVSVVARRNDVNANLVFNWRRRFREQAGGTGGLVPVVVEPPPLDAAAGDAPAAGRMEILEKVEGEWTLVALAYEGLGLDRLAGLRQGVHAGELALQVGLLAVGKTLADLVEPLVDHAAAFR